MRNQWARCIGVSIGLIIIACWMSACSSDSEPARSSNAVGTGGVSTGGKSAAAGSVGGSASTHVSGGQPNSGAATGGSKQSLSSASGGTLANAGEGGASVTTQSGGSTHVTGNGGTLSSSNTSTPGSGGTTPGSTTSASSGGTSAANTANTSHTGGTPVSGGVSSSGGAVTTDTANTSHTGGAPVSGGVSSSGGTVTGSTETVSTGGTGGPAGTATGGTQNPGSGGTTNLVSTSLDTSAGGLEQGGEVGTGASASVGGSGAGGTTACDAQPHVLATLQKPWAIAVDAGEVYFTSRLRQGLVARVPTSGGALQTLVSNELYPHELAVSNGKVFWATLGIHPGHLIQANTDGTERQEIGSGVWPGVFGVQADAQRVYYFTNFNDVFSVPIGGGSTTNLSGGPYDSFIVDMKLQGSQLYWTNTGINRFEETQPETAGVLSADVTGSTSVNPLVSRLDFPQFRIAVNEQSVFFSDEENIYRTDLLGGSYVPVATLSAAPTDESPIAELIADSNYVFYADQHSVYRVPVQGGDSEIVTDGWRAIGRMAMDESNLYFTDNSADSVVRISKCATGAASGLTPLPVDVGPDSTAPAAGAQPDAGCSGLHGCVDPTPIATANTPYGIALDDEYVYVSEYSKTGRILKVPLSGGQPEPVASNQYQPHDIALAGDRIFWCLDDSAAGHLVTDLKTGGATSTLATGIGTSVARVTSDGVFAYYITGGSGIFRVPVAGGDMSIIASGPYSSSSTDLILLDDEAFWTNDGKYDMTAQSPIPIADTGFIAKTHIVGTPNLNRTTLISPLNNPSILVPESYATQRIASDGKYLYYTDAVRVYRANRDGSNVRQLGDVSPASGRINDFEVSDGYAYFLDAHGLYRVPLAGGSTESLSTGWTLLLSLAINSTHIYFTDAGSGKVLRLAK